MSQQHSVYSMTGFGKSAGMVKGKKAIVEIRSLNSKGLDLNLKYPPIYREKENDIRNLIAEYLERGKVDFWLNFEESGEYNGYTINRGLVKGYYNQMKSLSEELNAHDSDLLGVILRMPDVVRPSDESISDEEWEAVQAVIRETLSKAREFRKSEGQRLSAALTGHVKAIEDYLTQVKPFEENRIRKFREKLQRSLIEGVGEDSVDANRFEQELIYYLEKLDIAEEKTRLKTHCDYFLETMQEKGYNGKKLNFISQEMGREINTLGAKAYDSDIQKLVVLMKDELEKIKEQVLNVL